MTKLPKSWKHWCKKYNLSPIGYKRSAKRGRFVWTCLKGKNNIFRVNCHAMFQSVVRRNFDRWALAGEDLKEIPIPTTEKEFANFVKSF